MRTMFLAGGILLSMLGVVGHAEALDVFGNVFQDTTWTPEGGPYRIVGDVTVLRHATLTIQPGTIVQAPGGDTQASGVDVARSELIVQGVLVAAGTADAPVVFGAGLNNPSTWYGIRLLSEVPGTRLSRVEVRGAHFGIRAGAEQPIAIDHTTIRRCLNGLLWESALPAALTAVDVGNGTGYGIRVQYPGGAQGPLTTTLFGVVVDGVTGHGVHVSGGDNAIVQGVSVNRASVAGVRLQNVAASTVTRSSLSLNGSHGLHVTGGSLAIENSLVFGNYGNGIHVVHTAEKAVQVVNNTIDGNVGTGLYSTGDLGNAQFVVQNNIVTNNYGHGVGCEGASLPVMHTNNVWNNVQGPYHRAQPDAWSISANPLFRSRVTSGTFADHPLGGDSWHRVNVNWQSRHNYRENEDHTWNGSVAFGRRVRIHLARLHLAQHCYPTCDGNDKLYLRDHTGVTRLTYEGDRVNRTNYNFGPIDTVNSFFFVMDTSRTGDYDYWGVHADRYEMQGIHEDLVADYRLQPGSPCADTGTTAGSPAEDHGGEERPVDGDFDGQPSMDIGAWEFFLNERPVADAGEDQEAFTEEEVIWDAGGSEDPDGEIVLYEWSFGDGARGAGPLVSHVYDAPGVYTVNLTVTDDYGDTDTDNATVTVEEAPPDPPNRPPTAAAGPDLRGETGVPLRFDGSASEDADGEIVSYQWSFGDGRVGEGAEVMHTYDAPGLYTVILVVTDDDGASASDLVQVDVAEGVDNSPPVADAGDDRVVHQHAEAVFDAGRSVDPDGRLVAFAWDFGDGEVGEGLVVTHTYELAGDFEVTLTVTDDRGATDEDAVQVHVNEPPRAYGGPNLSVPVGQEVELSAAGSEDPDGEIVSYEWDFGDGGTAEGRDVVHTWALADSYIVRVTVTDDDGASAEDLVLVTVSPEAGENLPPAAEAGPVQLVHHGERVVLSAADSADPDGRIVAFDWEFGDGNVGAGVVVVHTYEAPGTYDVNLIVQDDGGAEAMDSTTVTVNGRPVADAGPDVDTTVGEQVVFDGDGSEDADGRLERYAWEFGDDAGREGVRVTHQYAAPGTYVARLTVTDDHGAEASDLALVTVREAAARNRAPTADAGDDKAVEVGEEVVLSGAGSTDPDGRIVSWAWRFGDGEEGEGVVVRHAYEESGRYVATLVVTDDEGEESSDTATVAVNAPPLANAGPHRSAPAGDDLVFDGGASRDPDGDIVSWHWDFDDGTDGEGETVTHAFDAPGTYLVRLTVTDDAGATASDLAAVAITDEEGRPPNQRPVADAGGDLLIQLGERALLVGAGSFDPDGRIVSWSWDYGDGARGEGVLGSHVYGQPGPYVATLTVADDRGEEATDQASVTVNAPPVADAGDDQVGTSGELLSFDGSGSRDPDGIVSAWEWEFGDGEGARGETAQHAWAAAGTYVVRLTVTDNQGAEASDLAVVAIDVMPGGNRPPVADAGGDQVVQEAEEAVLSGAGSEDPDGEVVSWHWDLGDGNEVDGEEVRHTYAAAGTYTVTLTVTDDSAAEATDTARVRVNAAPVAEAGEDREIATGDRTLFDGTASSDPDGRLVAWAWDLGDGTSDAGALTAHVYRDAGDYTVTLTVTDDDGATATDQVQVTVGEGGGSVEPGDNRPPVADAGADRAVTAGEEVVFSGAGSQDPDGQIISYAWEFGDGGAAPGVIASHIYRRGGTFTVTLTVMDDDGARAVATATVTVNALPEAKAGPDARAHTGDEVVFDGSGSSDEDGEIVSYLWDFGDGATAEGASTLHAYTMPGLFTATLTVEDDAGAQGTDTRLVMVDERLPPVPERESTCAVAPTEAGAGAPALALLLVAWGVARRRRRERP